MAGCYTIPNGLELKSAALLLEGKEGRLIDIENARQMAEAGNAFRLGIRNVRVREGDSIRREPVYLYVLTKLPQARSGFSAAMGNSPRYRSWLCDVITGQDESATTVLDNWGTVGLLTEQKESEKRRLEKLLGRMS